MLELGPGAPDWTPNPDPLPHLLSSRSWLWSPFLSPSCLKGRQREEKNLSSKAGQIPVGVGGGGVAHTGPEGGNPPFRVAPMVSLDRRPGHRADSFLPGPPLPGQAAALSDLGKSGPGHPADSRPGGGESAARRSSFSGSPRSLRKLQRPGPDLRGCQRLQAAPEQGLHQLQAVHWPRDGWPEDLSSEPLRATSIPSPPQHRLRVSHAWREACQLQDLGSAGIVGLV